MKKGMIVEDGNHRELLRNYPRGEYANLISMQEQAEAEELTFLPKSSIKQESSKIQINGSLEKALNFGLIQGLPDPVIEDNQNPQINR